jgi:hypothetical protein
MDKFCSPAKSLKNQYKEILQHRKVFEDELRKLHIKELAILKALDLLESERKGKALEIEREKVNDTSKDTN